MIASHVTQSRVRMESMDVPRYIPTYVANFRGFVHLHYEERHVAVAAMPLSVIQRLSLPSTSVNASKCCTTRRPPTSIPAQRAALFQTSAKSSSPILTSEECEQKSSTYQAYLSETTQAAE
jgi:hypothetical protein